MSFYFRMYDADGNDLGDYCTAVPGPWDPWRHALRGRCPGVANPGGDHRRRLRQ